MTEYFEGEIEKVPEEPSRVEALAFKIDKIDMSMKLYILCLLRLRIISLLEKQAKRGFGREEKYTVDPELDYLDKKNTRSQIPTLPFSRVERNSSEDIASEAKLLISKGLSERRTAALLGVPRTTMRRMLKKYFG